MNIHSRWGCSVLGIKEIELFNRLYFGSKPISVHCDSQSTLSRAYNQVYNELSRSFTEGLPRKLIESTSYGNNLDKVHISKCRSEAASYELKGLALKHSEKPRYRPKANFNGSAQSGLNEREEGYA
ncbi:hypothetical protein Tco_0464114 [Tanacetum coccineum]